MMGTAPVQHVDPGRLRQVELFAGLSDEQLGWLADVGRPSVLSDGTVVAEEGEAGRFFWVLLGGEVLVTKSVDGQESVVSRYNAMPADEGPQAEGEPPAAQQYFGELPLLAGGGYISTVTAVGRTEVVAYDKETFLEMLARCPQVCRILLPVLALRIRRYEMQAGRTVMLEGLGTLAAGLAHELNNPVAAMVRDARELRRVMRDLTDTAVRWGGMADPGQHRLVNEIRDELAGDDAGRRPDPLDAADSEAEIADWLADQNLVTYSEAGIVLADHGADLATVRRLADGVGRDAVETAIGFLAQTLRGHALVQGIGEASNRVEGLIGSIKAYTNLDRAPKQEVDLAQGLEATLTMMEKKLAGITVHRDYADLPRVSGYPGELNQVWTNLIANAADAMDGHGELWISTESEGSCAIVQIRDSGCGIPESVLPKLFQPFFTTKDIGRGTGLGLHLSRDIVVHRHDGWIDVTSEPGDTRFRVRLPLKGQGEGPAEACWKPSGKS